MRLEIAMAQKKGRRQEASVGRRKLNWVWALASRSAEMHTELPSSHAIARAAAGLVSSVSSLTALFCTECPNHGRSFFISRSLASPLLISQLWLLHALA
jgi:hypothetical protein